MIFRCILTWDLFASIFLFPVRLFWHLPELASNWRWSEGKLNLDFVTVGGALLRRQHLFFKGKRCDDATYIISRNFGGFCTGKGGLSKFVCIVVVECGTFHYFLPFCRAAMTFLIEGTNASGWTTTFPSSPGCGASYQSGICLKKKHVL